MALPVLIHLINMLRHRRVQWAAMEFLLVSQKKHRTWVIFKQLLLLLLRMAAIAAVVLVVAQPLLQSRWGDLFGGTPTHHVVLLDDSYSMSDRWADTGAFSEAKKASSGWRQGCAARPSPVVHAVAVFARRRSATTEPDMVGKPWAASSAKNWRGAGRRSRFRRPPPGRPPRCRPWANCWARRTTSTASFTWSPTSASGSGTSRRLCAGALWTQARRAWRSTDQLRRSRPSEPGHHVVRAAEGIRPAGVPRFMDVAIENFAHRACTGAFRSPWARAIRDTYMLLGSVPAYGAKARAPWTPASSPQPTTTSSRWSRPARFREDLYYRICVIPISLPPLRERDGDVPLLLDHYMRMYCIAGDVPVKRFSPDAMQMLESSSWPGNVREIENLTQRLALMVDGEVIDVEHCPKGWSSKAPPVRIRSSSLRRALISTRR